MKANGVIRGKLKNLERAVSNLRSLQPLKLKTLDDWIVSGAIERNLQVAVEILVDICHRLVSLSGRTPAASSREALEECESLGVLSSADAYKPMVGFRNLIVHRYDQIDSQILIDIVNNHLDDFETFRNEVIKYVST